MKLVRMYFELFKKFYKMTGLPPPVPREVASVQINNQEIPGSQPGKGEKTGNKYSPLNMEEYKKIELDAGGGGFWKDELLKFVRADRHPALDRMIFYETTSSAVVYDKFPKAKVHLLVVTKTDIRNLQDIDPTNKLHIAAVKDMVATGEIVRDQLRSQLPGKVKFRLGFHALPSMNR